MCRKTIYNEIKRGLCLSRKMDTYSRKNTVPRWRSGSTRSTYGRRPEIKLGKDHAFANFIERKIIDDHYSPGAVLAYIEAVGWSLKPTSAKPHFIPTSTGGDVFLDLTEEHLLYKGSGGGSTNSGSGRKRPPGIPSRTGRRRSGAEPVWPLGNGQYYGASGIQGGSAGVDRAG